MSSIAPEALAARPAAEAIPHLMDDYADQIFGLGLRMCDDPEKAQDLVQETFLRALRAWDGFDGRSKPSTWLYTIASRACRRMERRRAGEPRTLKRIGELVPGTDTAVVDLPAPGETPDEWIEREDVVRAVRRAIDALPIAFRLPVVLKEIEGMSVEDVAAVLGVKPATVKTRLHRARLAIRESLSRPLPHRRVDDATTDASVCLDLLWAKQEALDRDAPFPLPAGHLCERCQSVFATLDLGADVCQALGSVKLPDEAREALKALVLRGESPA